MLKDGDAQQIRDCVEPICQALEADPALVDPEIPSVIRAIRGIADKSKSAAKLAGFGIVRCVESIFNAIFSFSRELAKKTREELLDYGPRIAARTLVNGLLVAGAATLFSSVPYVQTWFQAALSALRSLGVL